MIPIYVFPLRRLTEAGAGYFSGACPNVLPAGLAWVIPFRVAPWAPGFAY